MIIIPNKRKIQFVAYDHPILFSMHRSRGGSWHHIDYRCRSSQLSLPSRADDLIGFRIMMRKGL